MVRKERERRFISEYMLETWPGADWELNVELGSIPDDYIRRLGVTRAAALFRPTRPRVDAVKWTPEKYYIIEAKIRDMKSGIGDLTYYKAMAKKAPDLPFYDGQQLVCRLVIPVMLEWVREAADALDIEVVVFRPEWIDDYVRERQLYFTAEYRAARAEKLKLRQALDVE